MVFTPIFRSRVARSWDSLTTPRRMPCTGSTSGGLYSTKCRSPAGAPLSSMSFTGISSTRSVSSRGLPMVAEQQMNWGCAP